MIGPADVQAWAESCYDDFLRAIVEGRDFFASPLRRDRLGRVPASDDPASFAQTVEPLWQGSKQSRGFGYTVVLESRQRRRRGLQNEPVAVEFTTERDYIDFLGRAKDVAIFRHDAAWLLDRFPAAQAVLLQSPSLVRNHRGAWEGVAEVVDYLRCHPRPGCYMRALPVSVPTKFIEQHLTAVEALLAAHPECGYRADAMTVGQRLGFIEDEPSIRGRFLCRTLRDQYGFPVDDVELRVGTWSGLTLPPGTRVVACENKTNFLALPPTERTLALWGAGGAATGHFPRLSWLGESTFVYWGDLDPSGFAILAALRVRFPRVRSAMMDAWTLRAHCDALSVAKPSRHPIPLDRLTPDEAEALAAVSAPPRGLEQEKLLFRDGLQAINTALSHG
jgi:hypothetical protein